MVGGPLIKEVGRDDRLDDLLLDLLAEVLGGDRLGMLGRNDDGINTEGDHRTIILLVLDSDLGFRIRSEPGESTSAAGDGHCLVQLVSKHNGQGHVLLGLISGVTEHDTLITSTDGLERPVVKALSDIGRLLLNGNKNVASFVIKTFLRVVVTNLLDRLADDLLVVEASLGGNFTKDHDHTGLGRSLACDLRERVFGKAGVELKNRRIFRSATKTRNEPGQGHTMASET